MKPIRLSAHALGYCSKRGFTPDDVKQTVRNSSWGECELGRLQCRMDFSFGQEWNGKYYETRQVRPIFVEEDEEILVITGYVYYF